jgi:hypothetical protein
MQHQQREWACKQMSRVMKRVLHAELSAGFGKWVESVALVRQRLDGARKVKVVMSEVLTALMMKK